MSRKQYTIEDVRQAVKDSRSIAEVLRRIGLRPVGGNYKTVHRLILKEDMDTSHFTGQGWNVGLQFNPKPILSEDAIFVKDSDYRCTWRLRERYKN